MCSKLKACLSVAVLSIAMLVGGPLQAHSPGVPFLKGISTIRYDTYFEGRLDGHRCRINQDDWKTALQFVANQSARLKFVPYESFSKRLKELSDRATSLAGDFSERGTKAYGTAYKELSDYSEIPQLFIVVTVMELESGCAGTLRAEITVDAEPTKLLHTGFGINNPTILIWQDGGWFKGPHAGFAAQVISSGESTIKKLVNDWTEAQKR